MVIVVVMAAPLSVTLAGLKLQALSDGNPAQLKLTVSRKLGPA